MHQPPRRRLLRHPNTGPLLAVTMKCSFGLRCPLLVSPFSGATTVEWVKGELGLELLFQQFCRQLSEKVVEGRRILLQLPVQRDHRSSAPPWRLLADEWEAVFLASAFVLNLPKSFLY